MDGFSVTGDGAQAASGRRRRIWWWLLPCGVFVLGALLIVGGFVTFVSGYRTVKVAGAAMFPTVVDGDRLIAVRAVGGASVHRGDIVLFDKSVWRDGTYQGLSLFRILGVGGDTVSCCDGQNQLQVNGRALAEDYVGPGTHPDSPVTHQTFSATVAEGRVFVLGDDRGNSFDSRFHRAETGDGSIPLSAIQQRVVGTLHGSRVTTIPSTSAFRNAGLTGPSAPDGSFRWVFAAMGSGLVLTVLSVVGAGVFGLLWVLRLGRRAAGPPESPVAASEGP